MNKNVLTKIIALEFLLIFFYVLNGAFVSIKQPTSPFLQFALLIPFALGLFIYTGMKRTGKNISFFLLKESFLHHLTAPYYFMYHFSEYKRIEYDIY